MRKKVFMLAILILFLSTFGLSQKGLKVFISVDMEGVCGVIHWEDVSRNGLDYGLFRRLMTEETNAAVEGALAAGATEILVRDSHGSGRNILPDLLHPKTELIRDWSGGILSMMEGIDETFDAVIFVGYHARANTPDATLDHTYSGRTYEVVLNGRKMPEGGMNAFIAGTFGVPIAMVAGDLALCKQAQELFGDVVIAPVKEGIGNAAKMLHPTKARELIKAKATEALKRVKDFKPFAFPPPYVLEITYKDEKRANEVSWLPGAKRVSPTKVTYTSNDPVDILKFFRIAL